MPTALKKARGTHRPDRSVPNEMTPPVGAPDMPAWLDQEARAEWRRVAPMLEELGVLTEADRMTLANYCAAVSIAIQATKQVNEDGLTPPAVKGSKMRRVHPLIRVAQEARAQALRLGAEFGLTPAARSRVSSAPPAPKTDAAEEFIFGPPTLVK